MAFGPDKDIRIRKVANGFIVSHDRLGPIESGHDGACPMTRELETLKEVAKTEEEAMAIIKKRMKTL